MAQNKRKTPQPEQQRSIMKTKGARLYTIIILTIVVPTIIIIGLIKLLPADKTSTVTGHPAGVYVPPEFHNQGSLSFQKPEGKTIITLDMEVADNGDERQTGMMRRDTMPDNESMLFIFEDESERSFWMSNTMVPLDIIFINSKHDIVSIQKNAIPYDESHYWSGAPAKYVVEVRGGFCDDYNVDVGDKVNWIRTDVWQK